MSSNKRKFNLISSPSEVVTTLKEKNEIFFSYSPGAALISENYSTGSDLQYIKDTTEYEGKVSWSDQITGGKEKWSRHAVWKVPCFTKPANEGAQIDPNAPLVCLEVHTVTIEKVFSAVVPSDVILRFPASTSQKLDFGQMAVGQVEVAPVIVSNLNPFTFWCSRNEGGLWSIHKCSEFIF